MYNYIEEDFPLSINQCKNILNEINSGKACIDDYDIIVIIEILSNKKELLNEYKENIKKMNDKCYKYFSEIDSKKALYIIRDYVNRESHTMSVIYINAVFTYGLVNRLNDQEIIDGLNEGLFDLHCLLKEKTFSGKKSNLIHDYILINNCGVELLVGKFDYEKENDYYLPKFTDDEVNIMISKYISEDKCNINILHALKLHRNCKDTYNISTCARIQIDKKVEQINKLHCERGTHYKTNICVFIDENISDYYGIEIKGTYPNTVICLSKKWIDRNLDNATILNNLIYIIELCDSKMRINGLSQRNDVSSIMRCFQIDIKNTYGDNVIFDYKQTVISLIFYSYYKYLCSIGTYLEDAIQWFLKEYIPAEFNINGFFIRLSLSNDYYDRCNALFIQIENILKQFSILVDYGEITKELFEHSKYPFKFENYKSLIENKYVEISKEKKENDIHRIMGLLFTEKSFMSRVDKKRNEPNFVRLITKHEVKLDDFKQDYVKEQIAYLMDKSIIKLQKDKLCFTDLNEVKLLKDLYNYNYLVLNNLSSKEKDVVNKYILNGDLIYHSSLFSCDEADYLTYYLNNEKYANNKALRNGNCHPSKYISNDIEDEDKLNYINGLRILLVIIIKINDELVTKDEIKKKIYS